MSGTIGGDPLQIQTARQELEKLKKDQGVHEPNRSFMDEPEIKWRHGKPDYTLANLSYIKEKTRNHAAGSLEEVVEDLVKTWEMEASHKRDPAQWQTIDLDNFQMSSNGSIPIKPPKIFEMGNYNVLLNGAVRKELYDVEKETFESSHNLFRGAFKDGFPWELIQVFSGPPKVTFSWRHWATFNGSYRGHKGQGQTVEMYGYCVVSVNDKLKIQDIEVYYKPEEFLEVLEGKKDVGDLLKDNSLVGSVCPHMKNLGL